MPNRADAAKFRIGRSADVLYVQFYADVISDVKTKISGRRRKRLMDGGGLQRLGYK